MCEVTGPIQRSLLYVFEFRSTSILLAYRKCHMARDAGLPGLLRVGVRAYPAVQVLAAHAQRAVSCARRAAEREARVGGARVRVVRHLPVAQRARLPTLARLAHPRRRPANGLTYPGRFD